MSIFLSLCLGFLSACFFTPPVGLQIRYITPVSMLILSEMELVLKICWYLNSLYFLQDFGSHPNITVEPLPSYCQATDMN